MRYMMLIKHTEDYKNVQVPAGLYEAMGKFIEDATRRGQFVQHWPTFEGECEVRPLEQEAQPAEMS